MIFFGSRSLPLLLPAVEEGIFNDNWRIRQSSVELLGDLLFKVCVALQHHTVGGSRFINVLFSSRLLEHLEKHILRVVVMMRGPVLRLKDELLLRYSGGTSVMKSLPHCIWSEPMSA